MKNKNSNWIQPGDCYLIPDRITNFGKDGKIHPWIVINTSRGTTVLLPRTTKITDNKKKRGVFHPADRLSGFTKDGVILKDVRTAIPTRQLIRYEYLGSIGMQWLSKVRGEEIGEKGKNHESRPQTKNSVLKNPVLKPEIAQILKAQIEASERNMKFFKYESKSSVENGEFN